MIDDSQKPDEPEEAGNCHNSPRQTAHMIRTDVVIVHDVRQGDLTARTIIFLIAETLKNKLSYFGKMQLLKYDLIYANISNNLKKLHKQAILVTMHFNI